MKIAMTGSSGAGKTTLCNYIKDTWGLKHISGSAGDLKTPEDREALERLYGSTLDGHFGVIQKSALNLNFGVFFQQCVQHRREEVIDKNDNFITDRSPLDNLTYFINQVGFHKEVRDYVVDQFADNCLRAWQKLTHVIYVKACQPGFKVENNESRIANGWYQRSIDAQFEYWLFNFFLKNQTKVDMPKVMIINEWDLNFRKNQIYEFLGSPTNKG